MARLYIAAVILVSEVPLVPSRGEAQTYKAKVIYVFCGQVGDMV